MFPTPTRQPTVYTTLWGLPVAAKTDQSQPITIRRVALAVAVQLLWDAMDD